MGHIQDRWYRAAKDPETGRPILDAKGRPTREKTSLHGKGLRYKVRYVDSDGEEKAESFADKKLQAARNFLTKVENDVLAGIYVDADAGRVKFEAHAESWLKGQSQDAKTQETLRSRLRSQLVPYFGKRFLSSIDTATIREWLGSMTEAGLEQSYQLLLFDMMVSIMSAAIDDKKIRSNPLLARSVSRPKPVKRRLVPWTEGRLNGVASGLSGRNAIAVPLGAGAGLRQGEILGFSTADIDRGTGTLHVVRQIRVVGKTLVFSLPKGGKTRDVPLGEGVIDAVDDHVERYGTRMVTLPWSTADGRPETVELVLMREDGRPWYGDLFNKVEWMPAFAEAGLVYRRRIDGMHALRHFFASTLLANGVSIKELAEYLGHSDVKTTLETYTHLMPSSGERARRAVDTVFQPRGLVLAQTA
ncbi:site-specific integrase [Actinokineospora sp. PR83]|uniref:tyrosine-type recombinase/integrase n=1 Tax=Actinokineospora sp. PR83 TaxID=2884908 RepID=UPI0027DED023|nr:tyrosine-type recombinase/integrase [Actinokineospora sp. PR83]MCG8919888.1 site-specific integrase [Actinokineospora sp. PR83]